MNLKSVDLITGAALLNISGWLIFAGIRCIKDIYPAETVFGAMLFNIAGWGFLAAMYFICSFFAD